MADPHPLRLVEVAGVLGNNERRNPVSALRLRIGASRDTEDLADARVGDENFRAVQDVMIAFVDGGRLGASRIRPGARLREAKTAQNLSGREQGDEATLLLLRTEIHDRRGAERGMGADGDGVTRIDFRELMDDGDVRQVIHPRPAQVLRPRNAEQPELRHRFDVVPGEAAVEIVLAGGGFDDVLGEVSHHLAHLEMVVGEVEAIVHSEICSRLPEVLQYHGAMMCPRFDIPSHRRSDVSP